ncbi:MAG: hypothetical protein ABEH35_00820 [Haloarculaceae archaeon]
MWADLFPDPSEDSGEGEAASEQVVEWWLLRQSHLDDADWEVVKTWPHGERPTTADDLEARLYETGVPGEYRLYSVTGTGALVELRLTVSIGNAAYERLWCRENGAVGSDTADVWDLLDRQIENDQPSEEVLERFDDIEEAATGDESPEEIWDELDPDRSRHRHE